MNHRVLFGGLLVICLGLACAQNNLDREINTWYKTTGTKLIPETKREEVLKALGEAGANWHQLATALEQVRLDYRPGLIYLLINMPNHDLLAMRSDILVENVEYAYLAKEKVPWGKSISEELFQREVLPYRSTSEPIEKWRRDFFESVHPVVSDCKTSGEAALKVNEWVASMLTYKPSTWVQGPHEMLKSGYGRCGELTNFLVEAARSVCIPARTAYTPWWSTSDDNHAWVEVWDTGDLSWHAIDAANPPPDLTSFGSSLKKTGKGKVYAVEFRKSGTTMWRRLETRKDLTDVTERYVDGMGIVKIKVLEAGKAVPGVTVKLSVWNYSSMRPTASGTTDGTGTAEIRIGPGIYLSTAGRPGKNTWQLVSIGKDEIKEFSLELTERKAEEVVKMQ